MDAVAARLKPPLAVPRRLLRLRSDAVLAERFAAGDETAFAVLYERHRASVLAVCMGVLGSNHDAEDAAQDSFASLAVALRDHPPRELRPWLARVARNAAVDVARRRRRTVTTDGEVPDVPAGTSGAKAELENVMAGIRELPESQRTALLMRELAGHSYMEIATLLETDEEAIRGLIARARMSLRTHREASELSCASARATLAAELNEGSHDKTVRRHVRGCAPCRAYKQALRADARALRGIIPLPAGGVAGGGAIFGGLAAKGALLGGAMTQVTAACAVSACAVGGVVLLYPGPHSHRPPPARVARAGSASAGTGHPASRSTGSATRGRALAARVSTGTHGRLAGARVLAAGSSLVATAAGEAPRTGARAASAAWTATITGTGKGGKPSSTSGSPSAGTPASYTGFSSPIPAGSSGATGSATAGSPGYQRLGVASAPGGASTGSQPHSMNRPASDPAGATPSWGPGAGAQGAAGYPGTGGFPAATSAGTAGSPGGGRR